MRLFKLTLFVFLAPFSFCTPASQPDHRCLFTRNSENKVLKISIVSLTFPKIVKWRDIPGYAMSPGGRLCIRNGSTVPGVALCRHPLAFDINILVFIVTTPACMTYSHTCVLSPLSLSPLAVGITKITAFATDLCSLSAECT